MGIFSQIDVKSDKLQDVIIKYNGVSLYKVNLEAHKNHQGSWHLQYKRACWQRLYFRYIE